MAKQVWGPSCILSPLPVVLVTVRDKDGRDNAITIGWTGTVCSDPAMLYISVRKERFSHHMLQENGDFVVNLVSKSMVRALDYCGVRSGKDEDKLEKTGLHKEEAKKVNAALISESPINIECRVKSVTELGSHDLFLAEVLAIDVDDRYLDKKGRLALEKAELVAYEHGAYFELGKCLGTFGFSVKKKQI